MIVLLLGSPAGPDSITLLNLLETFKEKLNLTLFVCHINHGIRKESSQDEAYVKDFCEARKIPCFVKRIDAEKIAKEEKISTEEAGRNARYDFFEEILQKEKANRIATAHNANDNAETVLLNLLRGTGVSGLKGIEPIRDGKYIRPLLFCKRDEIEEYCRQKDLKPCIDQSNFENIYTRNKIRNQLIPMLEKEFNPSLIEGINRLADIARQEENYIEEMVKKEYQRLVQKEEEKNVELDLKEFQKIHPFIQNKLILYTIAKVCGTTQRIEKVHVDDIRTMCLKNIGNKYLTPYKGLKIEVKNKRINVTTMS